MPYNTRRNRFLTIAAVAVTALASFGASVDRAEAAIDLGTLYDQSFTTVENTSPTYGVQWSCNSCQGGTGTPGSFSWDGTDGDGTADGYQTADSSHATHVAHFNTLTGSTISTSAGGKIAEDIPGGSGGTYTLAANAGDVYYWKYGSYTSYILANASENITFTNLSPGPADLSHLGVVPLPASALLLLGGIAGLGALRTVRRKA